MGTAKAAARGRRSNVEGQTPVVSFDLEHSTFDRVRAGGEAIAELVG
jgi:hypothetical protein